jgi:hypothetical protein
MFAWKNHFRGVLSVLVVLGGLLAACGPTTSPSDLATQQSAAASPGLPTPLPTVAGTPVAFPLIAKQGESSSAALPVQSPEVPTQSPATTVADTPDLSVRFAVIGDYGGGGAPEADVASLVASWQPDLVITLGDNNYPDGASETIDANIGQFYRAYIFPYQGDYGEGAEVNSFFPTLGNHDWTTDNAQPYLDYFTLPGNERYYDFTWGGVHFFALDSDSREPDGVGMSSAQAAWLQAGLANSAAPWKIVYMHHPPYSSGLHGSVDWTRWPYQEWGADAVLSGHDHTYERLLIDGFPYFINGLGGGAIYYFVNILEGSQLRYNDDYGAMLVEADPSQITFQFITRQGVLVDTYTIEKSP